MTHPYKDLPKTAFWKAGVADLSPFSIDHIYQPRFSIDPKMRIVSAGSCFAQHISRELKLRNYSFLDLETAPPMLPKNQHSDFGFGIYSGRYGNIYNVRQLLQLLMRASGQFKPIEPIWEKNGKYFDPFRPNIQKNGFTNEKEVKADIKHHLNSFLTLLKRADLFIFTFGLTEAWVSSADGAVFPICPGVIAGEFNKSEYKFKNFSFSEILADSEAFISNAREYNSKMRFLFTVSPVPLTATASGNHVLEASTYSKSVLRAICGELKEKYSHVDYFPSYELIATHPMRGMFYQPNAREVSQTGVDHVMGHFFKAHQQAGDETLTKATQTDKDNDEDIVCEEVMLEISNK